MNYRDESYEKDLIEQSEALIDLAHVLTDNLPLSITGRLARALPDVIREEIRTEQQRRNRSLEAYEKAVKAKQDAEGAIENARQLLRDQVLCYIPVSMQAEIAEHRFDGPIIKGPDFSICLRDRYTGRGRFSYGTVCGSKLEINCNYEKRSFPQKKDGTYSVHKVVDFILEQREIRNAKERMDNTVEKMLEQFKAIVKPFTEDGVYGTKHEFKVSDNFSLKVVRAYGEDEKYVIWRTVSETVTAEQLRQILKNEVGEVQLEKQEV